MTSSDINQSIIIDEDNNPISNKSIDDKYKE